MAYRGLKSDLDVLQTVYTPFAGQPQDSDDSENDEVPPQRFAGGSGAETAAGFAPRGSSIQAIG
jgi:hypothetical protein